MSRKQLALFEPTLVVQALKEAVKKLNPQAQWRNPVMFIVWIGSLLTTCISIAMASGAMPGNALFSAAISGWLWVTVLFANFAEALAEGRSKAQANSLKGVKKTAFARKLREPKYGAAADKVPADQLRKGDIVLVEAGDIIPCDGEVIEGGASVDESAITGESAPVIRESGGDFASVTGGTRILSDWLVIECSVNPGETFLDRMIAMVEGAQRRKTPNEIALTILLIALTIVFLLATATLWPFSAWGGNAVSVTVLVALLVCLIPTTIGGLLSAIGVAGMSRMLGANVIATSGRAVEAAGDVDVLLLDKTGTITLGNRQASEFIPAQGVDEKTLADAAQLASLADETPEGRSIVILAKQRFNLRERDVQSLHATFVPFTAQSRMSGINIDNRMIRKGSVDAIRRHVEANGGHFPTDVDQKVDQVARQGATPLVVVEGSRVLGVIALKDIVKGGIKERFAQLRKMGIKTVMITGDNRLTAAAIAAEAGVDDFLAEATPATTELWEKVMEGIRIENATHAPVDFDTNIATTITAHDAGYINQPLEKIVGLQTDAPLKRALHPFGGINMIKSSFHAYGREMDSEFEYLFTDLRKTHNQGVFDVYSPDMLRCRKSGVLTGLPDGYGRGRIIGDYRRVALYGISYLVRERELQFADLQSRLEKGEDLEATIRLREELAEHRHALLQIQEMAAKYGFDISRPAQNAQEAVQWLYFAYLAAVKSQNGGAMSLGRTASFLDIYIERDFKAGVLNEQQAQELIDHFIMKIRMVRFLRTPEFDSLFSGDPIWATEVIGGMGLDGRTLVTKNSFRYLHTLHTMGPAPEPNLTILWSEELPIAFKKYAAQVSIVTSSLQYENDDLMRTDFNSDDYAIACCVSPMVIGKQMQFFGARANLAKTLLYAINGGVDEKLKIQVGPKTAPLMDDVLDYDKVMDSLDHFMDWLAVQYISALNIIHYMHDKYSYEASLMALHDRDVYRTMACGIAGLSVATDSLSAIKYARVKPIRDENGLAVDFEIDGEYPQYGNNDERVDSIACDLVERFMKKIKALPTYRNAVPTQSILTITSNVVYGQKTGNTPDGRRAGTPFAPGANPMHGRDRKGAVASLTSVAKLPFTYAKDGISYTFSIVPAALGKEDPVRKTNLVGLLDGYFHHEADVEGGQHLNVNVMNREMLLDAIEHPEKYPNLTIRVSGYAVRFNALTREQQQDVISRTFTQAL